jgi:selenocysteine lyase/cysteine desulfurase
MTFDLQRARRETPGTEHVLHFNNAGGALTTQGVLDAVIWYLRREVEIGAYEVAAERQEAIQHTYEAAATLIGASKSEIALMESADQGWNRAFTAISFKAGDRVLTSTAEYHSNFIQYLQAQKRSGIVVEIVPNDAYGQLDVAALRRMVDERVKLISVTHIATSGGMVNPVAEIGKVAKEHGILYLVDACQSVGQLPIDVQAIGCDMLATTGRKYLRAPRGTGFLYVRQGIVDQLEPLTLSGFSAEFTSATSYEVHAGAKRFENFETNKAAAVGLGVAIDYALAWGVDVTWRRIRALAYDLRARLSALPGVLVHDKGQVQCGIVTFTVEGRKVEDIQGLLKEQGINVTVTSPSATRLEEGLVCMVRASVHYYNSEEEVVRFCEAIEKLI